MQLCVAHGAFAARCLVLLRATRGCVVYTKRVTALCGRTPAVLFLSHPRLRFLPLSAQIFVVDSADRPRLEEAGIELNRILLTESLGRCPILVYVVAPAQLATPCLVQRLTAVVTNLARVRSLPHPTPQLWQSCE